VKIATKIYLITAGAAVLIIGDAAVDIVHWNRWREEQTAHRVVLDGPSNTLRTALVHSDALAGALRRPVAPGTRDWTEIGATGERALALIDHALTELRNDPEVRSAPADQALARALARADRAAEGLAREWRHFRSLAPPDEAARVATRVLVPLVEEDLGDALRQIQRLVAEMRLRTAESLDAQIERERRRELAGSALLLLLLSGGLYAVKVHFLHPLRRIEREARSVNRGESLHVGFTYTNTDELGAVARAVNDVIDRLRSAAFSREELERQVTARTAEVHERERELEESRAQLRRALDGSQLCAWEWRVQDDQVDISGLCTEILGYAPGERESSRETAIALTHPGDLPLATTALQAHLEGRTERYDVELRFRTRSGEWRWVRSLGRIVERDEDGRPLRLAGTHADIHARKSAELNLQRRDEQLRLALAASGSTRWDADLRERTVVLDERWAQLVGRPPGETHITQQELLHKLPADERPRILAALERVESGASDDFFVEHRFRRTCGRFVWVRSQGRCIERDTDGRALRLIGINVDITAAKTAEFAAARQAALYAAVNETALDLLARRGTAAVLQGLVDRATTLLDAPLVEVSLLDGEWLVPRAWAGPVPAAGLKPAGREAVLSWRAIDTRQPVVVANYSELPDGMPVYRQAGIHAVAIFPILQDNRAIGMLALCRLEPDHPFNPDDLEKGLLLAQLSALALHNARIYEDAVREADAKTAALRESEEKFRSLFDHGPVPMVLASFPEGKIVDMNAAVTAAFGVAPQAFVGRHVLETGLWPDAATRERHLAVLQETGRLEDVELTIARPDGTPLELLMHSRLVQIAGGTYSLNILMDVTPLKRTERALREGEARFHAVFEESPVMMILLSFPEGEIIEVNTAAEKGFGGTRGQSLGRTSTEMMAWADLADRDRYLHSLLSEGHVSGFEVRLRRRNGEVFSGLVSGSLIEIGGRRYSLNSVQDITAQRLAEGRLRQAQKMESLGTLAGGIAHDFNNLLTGILGSAELVRLDLPREHSAHRWLENIAAGGARAKGLVQQILAFSRRSEAERGPVDLVRVADEAMRLLRSTLPPMVQIEVELDRATPPIRGDATQLHQVIMNLCTNAWQALPSRGGRIDVHLAPSVVTAELQRQNPELPAGSVVRLCVEDNGCGIAAEVLPRIFDPFFTTKEAGRGTGLGLAVVDGIVRDHGGAILVRSTPGSGTSFELYFPVPAGVPKPGAAATLAAGDIPRGRQQRILFVDDDEAPRRAIGGMLDYLGYQVTPLGDPTEALRKISAKPTDFDLLLVDYAMPGLTGLDLARQVRQMRPTVPILIISGHLEADQRAESSRLRIAAVLSKPPEMATLARAVAAALNLPTT
jgi:PAS domain S-box-containing protein